MKIRPVEGELFHAEGMDGRTDMMKLTVAFRNVPNTNKNGYEIKFPPYFEMGDPSHK